MSIMFSILELKHNSVENIWILFFSSSGDKFIYIVLKFWKKDKNGCDGKNITNISQETFPSFSKKHIVNLSLCFHVFFSIFFFFRKKNFFLYGELSLSYGSFYKLFYVLPVWNRKRLWRPLQSFSYWAKDSICNCLGLKQNSERYTYIKSWMKRQICCRIIYIYTYIYIHMYIYMYTVYIFASFILNESLARYGAHYIFKE